MAYTIKRPRTLSGRQPSQPEPTTLVRRRIPCHRKPLARNVRNTSLRRVHRKLSRRAPFPKPIHRKVHKPPLHSLRRLRQHRNPQPIRRLAVKKSVADILRVHAREDAEQVAARLVGVGEVDAEGEAVDEALGDGELGAADLAGVGLRAGEVGRVDVRGEVVDFGGGEGRHEAGEVGAEAGVVGDARVGEEEAFVEVVGYDYLDVLVDFAGGEELAGVVGDEEAVDVGAWEYRC